MPKWTESGNLCNRKLKSCNSASDNWIFTQYITKSTSVNYTLPITVDIYGNTCSGCNNIVNVYYYPSNAQITKDVKLNTTNFIPIDTLSFGSRATEKNPSRFPLNGSLTGFTLLWRKKLAALHLGDCVYRINSVSWKQQAW